MLTRVTKVKGHATGGVVVSGQVRALDLAGNDQTVMRLIWVEGGFLWGVLTPSVILLHYVAFGTL